MRCWDWGRRCWRASSSSGSRDVSPRHQLPLGTRSASQKVLREEFLGQATLTWQPLLPREHRDRVGLQKRCSCLGARSSLPSLLCQTAAKARSASLGGTRSQLPLIHRLAQAGEADPSHFSGIQGGFTWLCRVADSRLPAKYSPPAWRLESQRSGCTALIDRSQALGVP